MSGLLRKSRPRWDRHVWVIGGLLIILGSGAYFFQDKVARLTAALTSTAGEKDKNVEELQKIGAELAQLRGEYENLRINVTNSWRRISRLSKALTTKPWRLTRICWI